jgi:hypothetical protein
VSEHNPDLYGKGVKVKPSKEARRQAIGGKVGIVVSRYPIYQLVSVKWDGKHTSERWHVDLLNVVR